MRHAAAGAFIGMSATNKGAFIASKQMVSGRRDRIVPFGGSGATIRARLDRNYFAVLRAPVTTIRPPKNRIPLDAPCVSRSIGIILDPRGFAFFFTRVCRSTSFFEF